MPFCASCGTENNSNVNFCMKCGASLGASVDSALPTKSGSYSPRMTFAQSIKTCFSKYADFKGRASRAELWWFNLFYGLVVLTASLINEYLPLIAYLSLLLPLVAVAVRRLHDGNRSGWFYLMALIPLVNLILLVWFCQRGTIGSNQYGPDPLETF